MSKEHLYLHVPYCKSICHYCDFCHRLYDEASANKWFEMIKKELATKDLKHLKTVYIGGGTPTSLSEDLLEALLHLFELDYEEFTLEVNPETMNQRKYEIISKSKVNRISIGMQSANDEELKKLGRCHLFEDVKKAISNFRAIGISNISLDIMYSLPFQTMASLKDTLEKTIALDVNHLSLYSLTIEENTVFSALGYKPLDEDIEADMYEYIEQRLKKAGYLHYEISNYCKEGYHSRHNMAYWQYNDFIGIGMGASGKEDHVRYENTRSFKAYLSGDIQKEVISLSLEDEMFEEVMMSLRTIYGLDLKRFEKRYGRSFFEIYKDEYEKHKNDFLIRENHLVVKNLELLNEILVDFLK